MNQQIFSTNKKFSLKLIAGESIIALKIEQRKGKCYV